MKMLGIKFRLPVLSDLPGLACILGLAAALVVFCMRVLGWDIGQTSAIIYGFSAAGIATASGVNLREHGLRGLLVVVLILVAMVASTIGLHLISTW